MTNTVLGHLLAAIIILIWTGFILVSRLGGIGALTPFDVVAIRLFTAAVTVLPLALRWGWTLRGDRRILALTLAGALGYTLLTYSGFRLAPAAHAGILLSGFQPFAMALCVWLVTRETPSPRRWLGIAIIATGCAVLGTGVFQGGFGTWRGDLLFVGGSLCWALYTVLVRRWRMAPLEVTVKVALLAAALYLPVYLLALPKGLADASLGAILVQAAYQGVLAAVIQMVIYLRAVELLGPSRMGMLVALVPPLGALAAVPVLGEPLTPLVIASLTLVSVGVLIGNSQFPLRPRIGKCPT